MINQFKIKENYEIISTCIAPGKRDLFLGTMYGDLVIFSLSKQEIIEEHCLGILAVISLQINKSETLLFAGDNTGHIVQFCLTTKKIIKKFDKVDGNLKANWITCLRLTPDSHNLFVSYDQGYLKQISIKDQKVVKEYSKVHSHIINAMEITNNNRW